LRNRDGMTMSQRFVHSINRDEENKPEGDYYKTPRQGTTRLLAVEKIEGPCWDCACGDGAIARVLEETGLTVYSSDLFDRGYGHTGVDFLTTKVRPKAKTIITNPPFDIGKEFCNRALWLPGVEKVCFIQRLLVLEAKSHLPYFSRGLARVWVFMGRVNICRAGEVEKWDRDGKGGGGMVAFAWFVWEKGYEGKPVLGWI